MEQFPANPLLKKFPKDFRMTVNCGASNSIECTFTAHFEYEVDAVITALIALRDGLRENVKPLPRSQSLAIAGQP